MKTKEADIRYCGVDIEKIKNAKPILNEEVLRYHNLFMSERHNIHKRKEIEKLPQQEWTDDEVFKNYRFTNVRRELDRESKWLIKNISTNPNLTLEVKILNSIFFRTYNKSSTSELFGGYIEDFDNLDIDAFREIFIEYAKENPKYAFFTPAFNTGGLKASWAFPKTLEYECTNSGMVVEVRKEGHIDTEEMTWKEAKGYIKENEGYEIVGVEKNMPTRMIHMIQWVKNTDISTRVQGANTQEEVFNILREIPGLAGFLAYQVFVDLTYIPEFKFSENEFVVSGPGCDRGIDLLMEDRDGMTHEEALFWVRDNIETEWEKRGLHIDYSELFDHLPEEDRKLNVMMCENSFCELQKIVSVKQKTGRPRNRYKRNPNDSDTEIKQTDEWLKTH